MPLRRPSHPFHTPTPFHTPSHTPHRRSVASVAPPAVPCCASSGRMQPRRPAPCSVSSPPTYSEPAQSRRHRGVGTKFDEKERRLVALPPRATSRDSGRSARRKRPQQSWRALEPSNVNHLFTHRAPRHSISALRTNPMLLLLFPNSRRKERGARGAGRGARGARDLIGSSFPTENEFSGGGKNMPV